MDSLLFNVLSDRCRDCLFMTWAILKFWRLRDKLPWRHIALGDKLPWPLGGHIALETFCPDISRPTLTSSDFLGDILPWPTGGHFALTSRGTFCPGDILPWHVLPWLLAPLCGDLIFNVPNWPDQTRYFWELWGTFGYFEVLLGTLRYFWVLWGIFGYFEVLWGTFA